MFGPGKSRARFWAQRFAETGSDLGQVLAETGQGSQDQLGQQGSLIKFGQTGSASPGVSTSQGKSGQEGRE